MLQSKTRWNVRKTDEKAIQLLTEHINVTPLIASLLVNRGFADPAEAEHFLHMDEEGFLDPFLMSDMDKAVTRIKTAIRQNEPILVYGDYDADGVTSTAIMMAVLRDVGAKADFYIPNRFTEGYGPNENAFRQASLKGINLIITVDNGISAVAEAALAKELGMDLIITDHHEVQPEIPDAYAIVHPRYGEIPYPFPHLSGAGIAFKLAHALTGAAPEHLLDLAAIGTVADLVSLTGENRYIVKKGILELKKAKRPGIKALAAKAGIRLAEATEETIGFTLGPRLNAAGRLQTAYPAAELLMSSNPEDAAYLAEEIEQLNKERKQLVEEITKNASSIVESQFPPASNKVLVIGGEGWHEGVLGIVASRLVEKFYRPVVVLSYDQDHDKAKGSARSIAGFDMFANLLACKEILTHFGGHPMAAGMTLSLSNVEELRSKLNQAADSQMDEEDFIPLTELDLEVSIGEVSVDSIREVERLSPFGMDNPKPSFLIKDALPQNVRKIGSAHNHLKLLLHQDGEQLDGIAFNLGHLADSISPDASLSVIGELSVNEWNNRKKPQMMIRDAAIDSWQLFDVRGSRQVGNWLDILPDTRLFVFFDEQEMECFSKQHTEETCLLIQNEGEAEVAALNGRNVVLFDLPPAESLIDLLIRGKSPNRIYAHFKQKADGFFRTIPTRDHFKWYYAFLAKQRTFDAGKFGAELEARRGWSKETVHFMTQVFFELEFVTINNGMIELQQNKVKKDLSDSPSYKEKQEAVQIEKDLNYSSYAELRSWFEKRIAPISEREEEVDTWI